MADNKYQWIDFYMELATKLLAYREDRPTLIKKIKQVYINIGMKLPKLESDNNPTDMDPFTVYGLFNKGISSANRILIIKGIRCIQITCTRYLHMSKIKKRNSGKSHIQFRECCFMLGPMKMFSLPNPSK